MEKDLRRSTRVVKINRDPEFYYDEDSVNILNQGSGETRQRRQSSESSQSPSSNSQVGLNNVGLSETSGANWSVLLNLPHYHYNCPSSEQLVSSDPKEYRDLSLSSSPNTSEFEGEWVAVTSYVNKPQCFDRDVGGVTARSSSTRYDLLEKEDDLFLSVSSSVRSDTSDMNSDKMIEEMSCECLMGQSCEVCSASSLPVDNRGSKDDSERLVDLMTRLLQKVNNISDDVKSVKQDVNAHGNRLKTLEEQVSGGSDMSENNSVKNSGHKKHNPGQSVKNKGKLSSVLQEKERQLNVLLDKIDANQDSDESSEDELNLGQMNKKLSSKKIAKREAKVAALINQVGGNFL